MTLIDSITNVLPPRYRSHGGEFIRFGIVGSLGFVVDTATVYSLRGWLGLYVSATISFLVAASFNWLLNRLWSFRGRAHDAAHIQWLRFLLANMVGFILNRGTFHPHRCLTVHLCQPGHCRRGRIARRARG
ncbi:MAG TPA: GtrA family protein [Acetobacteraceae bacterium]|nr:GtrA family protein [Acetobacteraceae bacterium]